MYSGTGSASGYKSYAVPTPPGRATKAEVSGEVHRAVAGDQLARAGSAAVAESAARYLVASGLDLQPD